MQSFNTLYYGNRVGKVGEARNEQGEKYTPCEFCGNKKISDTTTVFITADGNRYHTNLQCSGITRNIIEIDIKEVDNRKPCSSCNGDKMYWIWIMIFLCICTFTDIKKRNVCGWLCILNIVAAIMLHTIFRDISGKSLIEGAIIGGIFL